MKKLTPEITQKVKDILKDLPKEKDLLDEDYFCTHELMVYLKTDDVHGYDFYDFWHFKGISKLESAVDDIIKQYRDRLHCIDFKFSYEEGEFDQFTIYTHQI